MDFFKKLIDSTQASLDPLNFVAVIISALISVYISKGSITSQFIKERHDKLIFPIFNLLEPILYTKCDTAILHKVLKIIEANKNLADGRLIELSYCCAINPNNINFMDLCAYIDSAYDKSCKKIGLKTRSFPYRFVRHQYKSPFHLIKFLTIYILLRLLIVFSILFALLFLVALGIVLFESAKPINQLTMLFFFCIFIFLFSRYLQKNC
ncbi:MAG TPA: hypothetical protein DFH32_07325 [Lachnospiraceae bacterium]|nr:hypothetical protein [Lachnospiraceae bacterium]HCX41549.1 hypothetical protein [Lachnospiraceae bacterium]